MKWVIAIHDFGMGGSEKTVIRQANLLSERGHEVYFVTMLAHQHTELRDFLKIPQDHILYFPFRSYFDIRSYPSLIRFLWKTRPDVVLSASLFTNTILKGAKLFYPRLKLVVREGNVLRRHGLGSLLFDRITQGMIARYITNAHAIKEDLIYTLGIPAEKIDVLYNGIDTPTLSPPPSVSNIPEGAFVLLHVGSMNSGQKGQEYLIEALKHVPDNVYVIFVGDGHRKNEFETLSRMHNVHNRTFFLGKHTDPSSLMGIADVFVFPSLWEGMPNAVLEAMARGLPVIATAVGGIPEVLAHNISGLLVPPDSRALADAIARLYYDQEFRKKLASGAQQMVSGEQFTWEYHINKLISLCAG